MKNIIFLLLFIALGNTAAYSQDINLAIEKEFPLINLPYQTPKNLPFITNQIQPNLNSFDYIKNDVTEILKALKINLESEAKCFAIGRINYKHQVLLIYLETFKSADEPFYEYILKLSALNFVSDKSSMYLANVRYHDFKDDDNGNFYKQQDHLSSKIYLKNGELYIDSRLRLITDLVLNPTNKLKRTKNNLYKFVNQFSNNEFAEIPSY